ncbi:MAG: penicillin acylase family protein [Acidobacteriota bacterium]
MTRSRLWLFCAALIALATALPGQALQQNELAARARAVLSQTAGTLTLKGLQKPVRVLRDAWGIAHIYAATQDDLFLRKDLSPRKTGCGKWICGGVRAKASWPKFWDRAPSNATNLRGCCGIAAT